MDQKIETIRQRSPTWLNLCPGTKPGKLGAYKAVLVAGVPAPSGVALKLQSVPLLFLGQLDPLGVGAAVLGCFCIAAERKMDLVGAETHRPGPDTLDPEMRVAPCNHGQKVVAKFAPKQFRFVECSFLEICARQLLMEKKKRHLPLFALAPGNSLGSTVRNKNSMFLLHVSYRHSGPNSSTNLG